MFTFHVFHPFTNLRTRGSMAEPAAFSECHSTFSPRSRLAEEAGEDTKPRIGASDLPYAGCWRRHGRHWCCDHMCCIKPRRAHFRRLQFIYAGSSIIVSGAADCLNKSCHLFDPEHSPLL